MKASPAPKIKINRNPDEGRLFCDKNDPLFTADVVSHRAKSREWLGEYYTPGRLILPIWQLSEEVREMAAHVMTATQSRHEWMLESMTTEFIDSYHYSLGQKYHGLGQLGNFGTAERYRENWVPRIVIQGSLFDTSPLHYLQCQKENGLIGKYAELILARIVNGNITDMDGELPDITLDIDGQRVYVESKAARYSNNGKYITPWENKKNVSRRGYFIKRSQIYKSLALELSEERTQTYTAFVDYDLRGGENMTVAQFIAANPFAFQKLSSYTQMEALHQALQNTLIIKSITLLPSWALYDMWNRNVIRARSVTGKFKPGQVFRGETVPVAQYSEHSHTDHMIDTLRAFGVPEHTHNVSGLGKPGERIVLTSFGHRFLPTAELECQIRD